MTKQKEAKAQQLYSKIISSELMVSHDLRTAANPEENFQTLNQIAIFQENVNVRKALLNNPKINAAQKVLWALEWNML